MDTTVLAMSPLSIFPTEILHEILGHLPPRDAIVSMTVCKLFHALIKKTITIEPYTITYPKPILPNFTFGPPEVHTPDVHYVNGAPYGWTLGFTQDREAQQNALIPTGWYLRKDGYNLVRDFIDRGIPVRNERRDIKEFNRKVHTITELVHGGIVYYDLVSKEGIRCGQVPTIPGPYGVFNEWGKHIYDSSAEETTYYGLNNGLLCVKESIKYKHSSNGKLFVVHHHGTEFHERWTLNDDGIVDIYYRGDHVITLTEGGSLERSSLVISTETKQRLESADLYELEALIEFLDTLV